MGIDELRAKRDQILEIAHRHGVRRLHVFGSAVRGDATHASDVDFLIDVEGPTSPWFPGGLVADLEDLLDCRVDVVEAVAIREGLKDVILREAVPL